jgi:general secretion pathway protein A
MYEEFFGLSQSPFLPTPDPQFLYLTNARREGLAGLMCALLGRRGITVLTGEAGTGKTILLRAVLESISALRGQVSVVFHPTLAPAEFLELALLELGMRDVPSSKARRLLELREFLFQKHAQGRVVVLVVEEAHKLCPEVLEEIRLLTNFETEAGKLLQILLVAQNELDVLLSRPGLERLRQRIAYRLTLKPLEASEIAPYLRHRWSRAGAACVLPLSDDAIDYLGMFSKGIPRVINAICDQALALVCRQGVRGVWPEHIVMAARDLNLCPAAAQEGGEPADRAGPIAMPAPGRRLALAKAARSLRWEGAPG